MSIRPMQQFGSHWTDFHEIWYLKIMLKTCREVALKSGKNNRYLYIKTNIHFWKYTAQFFLEWKMLQTKAVEKIKTHILRSITFFRKSRRLWDNVEKYGRSGQATDDNTIRRMRFACWITKATNTHSEYVIPLFHCDNGCTTAPQCYVIRTF
jgi:hypothetical protein